MEVAIDNSHCGKTIAVFRMLKPLQGPIWQRFVTPNYFTVKTISEIKTFKLNFQFSSRSYEPPTIKLSSFIIISKHLNYLKMPLFSSFSTPICRKFVNSTIQYLVKTKDSSNQIGST